jgi:hypothetical protein
LDLFAGGTEPTGGMPLGAAEFGGVPAEILSGLDALASRRPSLWAALTVPRWVAAIEVVRGFPPPVACRGSDVELYGLDQAAPFAHLSTMGVAWLTAHAGFWDAAATGDASELRSAAGARLSIVRRRGEPGAVLPWTLGRPVR